jgi:Lrp/AsnC family transcriptional regulator, regulator for asnA, asnC and gidA
MVKIDKTDIAIVNLLIEDGRMSCAEVSRRLGDISERAVRYRINRLVKEQVMRVSAIANPRAVGLQVIADVWIEVDADAIQQVAQKMAAYDCISYVAYSIGENDISVQVVAADTGEVYRFVTEIIRKVPGVRKTTTSIVPLVLKDVYQWRIPSSACLDDSPPDHS